MTLYVIITVHTTKEEIMVLTLTIIMMIIGFLLLVLGADMLVKGSSNIAKRFHIPEMLIGLTIVALGTSMPELVITISSAGKGATDLIIGNAIGSNICNLLLILGVTATLRTIEIDKDTRRVHLPVALLSNIAILIMGLGLFRSEQGVISRNDGKILVILYGLYFLYPILVELKDIIVSIKEEKKNKDEKRSSFLLSIKVVVIGAVFLKYGGDVVVNEATKIATIYGISEKVIGLTIVAIGTALPELITSIIASVKGEQGLAVGNLIGSCILNSFLILGTGAIITPLSFSTEFIKNLIFLIFSIVLIMIFCHVGKRNTITRYNAGILLAMYVIYMFNLIW